MFKPGPGQGRPEAGARPGADPRPAQRRRQDLDLQAASRASSSRTARPSPQGRQVRGRASLDKTTFPNGPTYFNDYLDLQGYTSPYKDTRPDKLGLKAIETPDDTHHRLPPEEAVLRLRLLRACCRATIPVPQAKDTGAKYKEHVVSTGPYMFESYTTWARTSTLVRNTNWDPTTDPNRKALPDEIDVALNINADDIDNRLISGRPRRRRRRHRRAGRRPRAKILADPTLKANADNPPVARLWYTSHQRRRGPAGQRPLPPGRGVRHRQDRLPGRVRRPLTGGDIATNLHAADHPGLADSSTRTRRRTTPATWPRPRRSCSQCGQPNGFETNISYRAERPKEKAAAEALQQSLAKVGIKLTIKPFPQGDYFKLYAGKPDYAKKQRPRPVMHAGWGADWTDGFGFLSQIVDSRVIRDRRQHQPRRQGPGGRQADRQGDHHRRHRRPRRDLGQTSTRRSWTTRTSCRALERRACSTGRRT